jgi:glycosyltransferase involved in cell wall biosynthesis
MYKQEVMEKLSAVIITYNEEKNIGRCIESLLPVADEIIVLDSFSDDNTVSIAVSKGAIVHQQAFAGYKQQKNAALAMAANNYVLSLDADEVLSNELTASINEAKKGFAYKAYCMNRCNVYCGKYIRHGLWYPDRKLRLFDKRTARWVGYNPHDRVEMTDKPRVQHLKGDIIHFAFDTVEAHRQKNRKVALLVASSMMEAGVRPQPYKIIVNPLWSFVNGYLLRLGIVDGYYGLLIAWYTAGQSFQKHINHRRLGRRQEQGANIVLQTKQTAL